MESGVSDSPIWSEHYVLGLCQAHEVFKNTKGQEIRCNVISQYKERSWRNSPSQALRCDITLVELSWVYLTADSQSTSSSWFRTPLWGPWPDFILIFSLVSIALLFFRRASSLTGGRVCNLQCNRWLVRSLRTNNHTLPSHLRLCSLYVASYDSQGLRWRYSNPPPHRIVSNLILSRILICSYVVTSCRISR
jgi:hypothetical protein